MTIQEMFNKNLETYHKLSSRSMKTMQAFVETSLEQNQAMQSQSQDMLRSMMDYQTDMIQNGFKTAEVEMENWTKVMSDVVSEQLAQVDAMSKTQNA